MTVGIYKFTNLVNGKKYIGQSKCIERRYKDHINRAYNNDNNNNKQLYKAIRKYGLKNFNFSIIEECLIEELNDKEIYWIKHENSLTPNGYNITTGGECICESFLKYTPKQISEVINLLQNTELTYKEIKEKIGIQSIGLIGDINNGNVHKKEYLSYPLRTIKIKESKNEICPICNNKKEHSAIMCHNCRILEDRKTWQSREILKQEIRHESFVQIGKKYGISDNGIRKRCKAYGLPYKKKDIKAYSDIEWEQI